MVSPSLAPDPARRWGSGGAAGFVFAERLRLYYLFSAAEGRGVGEGVALVVRWRGRALQTQCEEWGSWDASDLSWSSGR